MHLEEGLRIGRLFESEFVRQAHIIGYHIVRHYDQLGVTGTKAPVTSGPFAGYRLPDATLMRDGESFWVEVKYKTAPTFTGITQTLDHGIDWPNWCDYLKLCEISGQRGFLVIGEGSTGEILSAPFDWLEATPTRYYPGPVHFKDGAAFWPRDRFQPWGHFSPQTGQMHFAFKPLRPVARDLFGRRTA
jgi:hypothetical protein